MLSLLVLITAAKRGYGFTKLTICDLFAASDFLGERATVGAEQRRVLAPLALGPLHGPPFPIRQQEKVTLAVKDVEG